MGKQLHSESSLMRTMLFVLLLGLLSVGCGLYLLWFTTITEQFGVKGLAVVVVLIAIGLMLLVPAKVYIILRLMKHERRGKAP